MQSLSKNIGIKRKVLVEANKKSLVRDRKIGMQRFNEWMSCRQSVDTPDSEFQFIGTYDIETIPNLKENSHPLELQAAFELIPEMWKNQFPNVGTVLAGKTINEENKEILWISIPEQSTTYLFQKN